LYKKIINFLLTKKDKEISLEKEAKVVGRRKVKEYVWSII